MKPYGVPRLKDLESPDCADIHKFGLKSSKSRVKGIGGDIKNSFRKPQSKKSSRRVWKGKERQKARSICKAETLYHIKG